MSWRCSFGVLNCPICLRPRENDLQAKIEADKKAKRVAELAARAIAAGRARVALDRFGKITITGLTTAEREGASDLDIITAVMNGSSSVAKAKIPREALARQNNFNCN